MATSDNQEPHTLLDWVSGVLERTPSENLPSIAFLAREPRQGSSGGLTPGSVVKCSYQADDGITDALEIEVMTQVPTALLAGLSWVGIRSMHSDESIDAQLGTVIERLQSLLLVARTDADAHRIAWTLLVAGAQLLDQIAQNRAKLAQTGDEPSP